MQDKITFLGVPERSDLELKAIDGSSVVQHVVVNPMLAWACLGNISHVFTGSIDLARVQA